MSIVEIRPLLFLGLVATVLMTDIAYATGNAKVALFVPKHEYVVDEPVSLTWVWSNDTASILQIELEPFSNRFPTVLVSIDGSLPKRFMSFSRFSRRSSPKRVSESMNPFGCIDIRPGEKYSRTLFVVNGLYDDKNKDFLLYRPGKYVLFADASDTNGVVLKVSKPIRETDTNALVRWRAGVADDFDLAPIGYAPPINGLNMLTKDFPDSVFAQYARLGAARQVLALRPKDAKWALRELDRAIDDRSNPAIVEHAIYWKIMYATVPIEEKRKLVIELKKVHPRSGFLKMIEDFQSELFAESSYMNDARTNVIVSKVVQPPVTLCLDVRALERVSTNAARCVENYWKAICARDVDAALGALSEEFVGDEGGKERRRCVWEKQLKVKEAKEVKVSVEKVERVGVYTCSSSPPSGESRKIMGNLLVVEGCMTVLKADNKATPRQVTWVLESHDDKAWFVRSEHVHLDLSARQ